MDTLGGKTNPRNRADSQATPKTPLQDFYHDLFAERKDDIPFQVRRSLDADTAHAFGSLGALGVTNTLFLNMNRYFPFQLMSYDSLISHNIVRKANIDQT